MTNDFYLLDYFFLTSITICFPIEYIVGAIVVLVAYPTAQASEKYTLNLGPYQPNYSILGLVLLCISFPYFLSTLLLLCKKRDYLLETKAQDLRRKKRRSD